jgi:hypothetical protein
MNLLKYGTMFVVLSLSKLHSHRPLAATERAL